MFISKKNKRTFLTIIFFDLVSAADLFVFYIGTVLRNYTSLDPLYKDCVVNNPTCQNEMRDARLSIAEDIAEIDREFVVFCEVDPETQRPRWNLEQIEEFNQKMHMVRRKIASYLGSITALLSGSLPSEFQ